MLQQKVYIDCYSLMEKYLCSLTNSSIFFKSDSTRKSVKVIIVESIHLFLWLSKQSCKEKEALSIIDNFKKVFLIDEENEKDNFEKFIKTKGKTDFSKLSEYQIRDEINYLHVCAKNICDIDLDSINLEDLKKEEEKRNKYTTKPSSISVYQNFFNDIDSNVSSDVEKTVDDMMIRSHAQDRLNQDIESGSIYIYKTKPRRNVIVKYVLMGLFLAGIAIALCLSIINVVNSSAVSAENEKISTLIFSIIYFVMNFLGLKKSFLNDNYKYSFQRKHVFFNLIFFSIFGSFIGKKEFYSGLQKTEETVLWSLFIFVITSIFLLYLISYIFLQPKKDRDVLDSVLKKHISDSGSFSLK